MAEVDPGEVQGADATMVKAPKYRVNIYRNWCKGCGICVEFCKHHVFAPNSHEHPEVADPAACTGCQDCVLHCPDFALQVDRLQPRSGEDA